MGLCAFGHFTTDMTTCNIHIENYESFIFSEVKFRKRIHAGGYFVLRFMCTLGDAFLYYGLQPFTTRRDYWTWSTEIQKVVFILYIVYFLFIYRIWILYKDRLKSRAYRQYINTVWTYCVLADNPGCHLHLWVFELANISMIDGLLYRVCNMK